MTRQSVERDSESLTGSALIVVLWVIGLLSILISSFAFDMHVEAKITSYYRKRLLADHLARAGVEWAQMVFARSAETKKELTPQAKDTLVAKAWYPYAKRIADGLAVNDASINLGEGTITVSIIQEPARRNVNRLTPEDWVQVLAVGNVPEEEWDGLIDSFLDWTDNDDEQRVNGAETDYYAQLDPPYKVKNGPLDTVEELLLIKGFTREILVGGLPSGADEDEEPMSGISDLLTVFGDGRVNVNAASKRVLMTLPAVDEIVAEAIIDKREGWIDKANPEEDTSFKSVDDLFSRVPNLDKSLKNKATTSSNIYRITSVGSVHGIDWTISCIVHYQPNGMVILRWVEQDLQ